GRHFPDAGELVLLELDPAAVAGDLRWEESRPGERFPHLYRPLRPGDVVAVHRWRRAADGTVALPSTLAWAGRSGSGPAAQHRRRPALLLEPLQLAAAGQRRHHRLHLIGQEPGHH